MTTTSLSPSKRIQDIYTLLFTVLICIFGLFLMRISSSPIMRGAAFLWFPAAFQLIAGVWLGPIRGAIAGGLGAYAAGILAYGGFGLPDIIMNLFAGSMTNAALPAVLFRWLKIDPSFGAPEVNLRSITGKLVGLAAVCFVAAIAIQVWVYRQQPPIDPATGGDTDALNAAISALIKYIPSLLILLSTPLWLTEFRHLHRDFRKAFAVIVLCSFLSASCGVLGGYVTGKSILSSIVGIGAGWFFGNSVACILGLFLLAAYTQKARARRISSM